MLQPIKNMNYSIKIVSDANKENIAPYFISSNNSSNKRNRSKNQFGVLTDITSKVLKKEKKASFDKIVKLY